MAFSASRPADEVRLALLDTDGVIVGVNRAWERFARSAGADPARTGVGRSYLEVCEMAGDPTSLHVADVIRAALGGGLPAPEQIDVPCLVGDTVVPFGLHVASRFADDGSCCGATVTFSTADARQPARPGADAWADLEGAQLVASQALESVGDTVVILDTSACTPVYANQAAMAYLSTDADGRVAASARELLDGDMADQLREALQVVARCGAAMVEVESPVRRRDGGEAVLDIRVSAVGTDEGGPRYVMLVGRDVSERVAAQQRLRLSETSFRAAFENSPFGNMLIRLAPDGSRRVVSLNAAAAAMFEMPAEAVVGLDMNAFDPESRELAADIVAGRRHSATRQRTYRRADGTLTVVEVSVTRIELEGSADPAILSHVIDVTDKVQAQQRRERQVALARAHADVVTAVLAGERLDQVERQILDGLVAALGAKEAFLVRDAAPDEDADPWPRRLVVPFEADGRPTWVVVARDEPFDADEQRGAQAFCHGAAVALELGRARADQERVGLLEERQRLARDLHDTVLQDLIGMGIQLGIIRQQSDGEIRDRVVGLMGEIVETVRKLRGAVFQLRRPVEEDSVEETMRAVVGSASRALGHRPVLTVDGPLESLSGQDRSDLAAALQEALSNVVRHAGAHRSWVTVSVDVDRLTLTVADDGPGPVVSDEGGFGLANLAERAAQAGGTSVLEPGRDGGSVFCWSVPRRGDAGAVGESS